MRQQSLPLLIAGLRSDFYEGRATVDDAQALGKIVGPLECVAVILQNRLNNLDDTANPLELMLGTGAGCNWQMLPGVESPIVYCNNLNDVWVKVRVAVQLSDTEGGIVAFTVNNGGVGYAVDDLLTANAGDVNATLLVTAIRNGEIFTTTLNAGGAGYSALDVLTVTGGSGTATIRIDTVDGGGAILTYTVLTKGSGYAVAAGVNLTGGGGAGGKINITAIHSGIVTALSVIDPGSGYAIAVGVALTGGTGNGATINVTEVLDEATEVTFPFIVYSIDPAMLNQTR